MNNDNFFFFESLDSTNKYAKENLSNYSHNTVIVAKEQTNGSGRLNRAWSSEEGGLYFSIILKPKHIINYPNLTQIMAISIIETLKLQNIESNIKWPNDIFVDNKKISGILSEAVFCGNKLEGIVLGVGVNINQKQDFSEKIDQPATSIYDKTGNNIKIVDFLDTLYTIFISHYEKFIVEGFRSFKEIYLNSFPFIGKETEILLPNNTVRGTIATVSELGALVVIDNSMKEHHITMGDMIC